MLGMIFVEIFVLVQKNCLFKVEGVAICYENSCSYPEIYLWGNSRLVELRTVECNSTKTELRCIYFKGICICLKYIYKVNRVLLGRKSLDLWQNFIFIYFFTSFLSLKLVLWNIKAIAWKQKLQIVHLN